MTDRIKIIVHFPSEYVEYFVNGKRVLLVTPNQPNIVGENNNSDYLEKNHKRLIYASRKLDEYINKSFINDSKAEVEILPNVNWKFSKEKWLEIMRQSGNVQYKPKHKMKNLKFRIKSKEYFEALISRLIELGYNSSAINPYQPYRGLFFIYTNKSGLLGSNNSIDSFNEDEGKESTLDDLYEMDNPKKKYEFTTSQKEKVGICQHWDAIFIEDKNGRDLIQISFEDIFSIVKLIEDFKNGN